MLAATAALPGCGFRPIYASRNGVEIGPAQEGLAGIAVQLLPNRYGQLVRQALQSRFDRAGTGIARRYDLAVALGIDSDTIGIRADSGVTRVRLVGIANWTLTAQDPQRSTLSHGMARAVDAYDIANLQFLAADFQSDAVLQRIAEALAEQVTLQLATYFNRHAA